MSIRIQCAIPLLFVLALCCYPDDRDSTAQDTSRFRAFLNWTRKIQYRSFISSVTIEGRQWTRLNVRPDFPIGPFGVALDFELFLDTTWTPSDKGYRFHNREAGLESLSRRLFYVRYNRPGDSLYFKLGNLEYVTLGYGFLVRDYTNAHEFPEKKTLGVHLEAMDMGPYGLTFQAFMDNIGELYIWGPLMGLRAAFRPLGRRSCPHLSRLEVGLTGAADFNQNQDFKDVLPEYRHRVEPDAFHMFGADAGLPVAFFKAGTLSVYGQAAVSRDDEDYSSRANGFGVALPGLLLKKGPIRTQFEVRHFRHRFRPEYFNFFYDYGRHLKINEVPHVQDAFLDSVRLSGFSCRFNWDLWGYLRFEAWGQALFGDTLAYDQFEVRAGPGRKILRFAQQASGGRLIMASLTGFYHKSRIDAGDDYFSPTPFTFYGLESRIEFVKWLGAKARWTRRFLTMPGIGALAHEDRINIEPFFKF